MVERNRRQTRIAHRATQLLARFATPSASLRLADAEYVENLRITVATPGEWQWVYGWSGLSRYLKPNLTVVQERSNVFRGYDTGASHKSFILKDVSGNEVDTDT
jgi:hypothetical protein